MQIAFFLLGKYARNIFFTNTFRRMDWQQLAISMLTLFLPLEGDNFQQPFSKMKAYFVSRVFVQALLNAFPKHYLITQLTSMLQVPLQIPFDQAGLSGIKHSETKINDLAQKMKHIPMLFSNCFYYSDQGTSVPECVKSS